MFANLWEERKLKETAKRLQKFSRCLRMCGNGERQNVSMRSAAESEVVRVRCKVECSPIFMAHLCVWMIMVVDIRDMIHD